MITIGKLSFEDQESAEEYFEDQFFEIKKQLQAKPLLRATSRQKIKALEELREFESVIDMPHFHVNFTLPDYSGLNMHEAWLMFSNTYSIWKLKSFNASSPSELLELIEKGFELQKDFYALIPEISWEEEDPKVGVTEQLMHLQGGFNLFKEKGINLFRDLSEVPFTEIKANETAYLFFLELKRLSLRFQYV